MSGVSMSANLVHMANLAMNLCLETMKNIVQAALLLLVTLAANVLRAPPAHMHTSLQQKAGSNACRVSPVQRQTLQALGNLVMSVRKALGKIVQVTCHASRAVHVTAIRMRFRNAVHAI